MSTAIRNNHDITKMVLKLSMPAILAEISSVVMQYIDAAMVGSLGASATASIGIVSSSTWLIGGVCMSAATGFSVQVSQLIGAGRQEEARNVLRQSLIVTILISLVLAAAGIAISSSLPAWLGGVPEIHEGASLYFLIYACTLPIVQLRYLSGSMLQCSGDMRTPSILNTILCGLDVVFNGLLIFPARQLSVMGISLSVPGAGLGVAGAALGTSFAEVVVAVLMLWRVCIHSEALHITGKGSWKLRANCMRTAAYISIPMAFEHGIMSGAQVMSTRIVAPLGTAAVAANSLAVTAESLCYMPGYGVSAAATTLVGQSIGAGNLQLTRKYARRSVLLGTMIMTCMGALMFIVAPAAFAMLTPDKAVQALGVRVLRIEMFAEPFFAISIVTAGALRGAGDTLIPSILNLLSMWGIRITAAALLAPRLGLVGVWIAMCGELCIRGILFLIRLLRERWLKKGSLVG